MSRQNKNARNRQIAKRFTALHKGGQRGPSSTECKRKKNRVPRVARAQKVVA